MCGVQRLLEDGVPQDIEEAGDGDTGPHFTVGEALDSIGEFCHAHVCGLVSLAGCSQSCCGCHTDLHRGQGTPPVQAINGDAAKNGYI